MGFFDWLFGRSSYSVPQGPTREQMEQMLRDRAVLQASLSHDRIQSRKRARAASQAQSQAQNRRADGGSVYPTAIHYYDGLVCWLVENEPIGDNVQKRSWWPRTTGKSGARDRIQTGVGCLHTRGVANPVAFSLSATLASAKRGCFPTLQGVRGRQPLGFLKRYVVVLWLLAGLQAEPGSSILLGVILWASPLPRVALSVLLDIFRARDFSLLRQPRQHGMYRCLHVLLRLQVESHRVELAHDFICRPAKRRIAHHLNNRIRDAELVEAGFFAAQRREGCDRLSQIGNVLLKGRLLLAHLVQPVVGRVKSHASLRKSFAVNLPVFCSHGVSICTS